MKVSLGAVYKLMHKFHPPLWPKIDTFNRYYTNKLLPGVMSYEEEVWMQKQFFGAFLTRIVYSVEVRTHLYARFACVLYHLRLSE